jgi:hypothetical protein
MLAAKAMLVFARRAAGRRVAERQGASLVLNGRAHYPDQEPTSTVPLTVHRVLVVVAGRARALLTS